MAKNALIMEDLSSLSSISMNVANPIIASYGLRTFQIPVQTFVTQTEVDERPKVLSSVDWLQSALVIAHRQFQREKNVGLIGYLGKNEIIDQLVQSPLMNDFQILLVDPVMADGGSFYPELGQNYCQQLKKLLPLADVITPNVTELSFLTENHLPVKQDLESIITMVEELRELVNPQTLITVTGIEHENQIGCYWNDGQKDGSFLVAKVPGHFYGTGDAYAASLMGELSQGYSIQTCLPQILQRLQRCVRGTFLAENDLKLGIDIMPLMRRDIEFD